MSERGTLDASGRLPAGELLRLSGVKPEPVRWLWAGRFPLGRLSEVSGDPGLGKSTLLYDLAARVTRGDAMPDGSPGPGLAGVFILSAEDDLASVIRPRFEAAGADLDRVGMLRLRDAEGEPREPTLADLAKVEQAVFELEARLVIVDPLMDYLPKDVDAHRDQDVRRPLAALRGLAERTGAAVVIVRHLNKSQGGSPLYRPGGSIGITATMRAGHLLAADPAGGALVLAPTKSSLAPMPKPLRLRLVADHSSAFARVQWEGPCEHSAASLLAPPPMPEERSAVGEAEDFLRELLAGAAMPAHEVLAEAKAAGIAERTLKRARQRLDIVKRKEGRPGEEQRWTWELREGGKDDVPKRANDSQPGPLREAEPMPSTCDACDAEGGQARECGPVREAGAGARALGPLGPHRDRGDANSARGVDVVEGGQEAKPWPPSGEPGSPEEVPGA